tara:strand:- start:625 stop:1731 length:1107 start_codon:yes stop_codon:yes gene_type:complete
MIKASDFIKNLIDNEFESFYGVPDSLLSSFSKSLYFDYNYVDNFITANEGSALSMAMGYNLSTKKAAVVYMQNSGLGNIINPYSSLLNENIYNIPFLLIVGWRGEPGITDEPQHIFQGKKTLEQLELLDIKYSILDSNTDIDKVVALARKENLNNKPYSFVVKKDFFQKDERVFPERKTSTSRKEALKKIVSLIKKDSVLISTTGKLSRELYEYRFNENERNDDLYLVGGMGHTFSVAFSVAYQLPNKDIYCLDGDGSIIMHMGSMGLNNLYSLKNFTHIVFNNSSHESVGGQQNYFDNIDVENLTTSLGYKSYRKILDIDKLDDSIFEEEKPLFIDVHINNKSDSDLMRPKSSPEENKKNFIKKLFS